MFLFLLSTDLKQYLPFVQEGHSHKPQRGYGRPGPWGEGCRHPSFQNTNSKQRDVAGYGEHEGWLPSQNASVCIRRTFFIYTQIKDSPRDERVVLAYKILCISSNRCTERCNGIEQTGVPDALALLSTRTPNISSAWPGPFMMAPCWWACGLNFWAPCPGAPCWWGCSDTSTGATRSGPLPATDTRFLGS